MTTSSARARPRGWRLLWTTLAAMPVVAAGLLLLFAADTSRAVGHWPRYADPDPKDANQVLYWASGLTLTAAIPSSMMLVVGLALSRRLRFTRADGGLLLVAGAGLIVLAVLWSGDLGDWYVD